MQEKLGYEVEAARGGKLPDGLSLPDQFMYIILRNLYAEYRKGNITSEQAKEEVGKARRQRDILFDKIEFYEKCAKFNSEMYKSTNTAACDYARERTVENADKLYEAIYHILPTIKEIQNEEKQLEQS